MGGAATRFTVARRVHHSERTSGAVRTRHARLAGAARRALKDYAHHTRIARDREGWAGARTHLRAPIVVERGARDDPEHVQPLLFLHVDEHVHLALGHDVVRVGAREARSLESARNLWAARAAAEWSKARPVSSEARVPINRRLAVLRRMWARRE